MAEIRASSISNLAGTGPIDLEYQSAARASWRWTGTGTPAIDGNLNVSSITDNGTGDYTFSYTNDFANSDYTIVGMGNYTTTTTTVHIENTLVGSCDLRTLKLSDSTSADTITGSAACHGDLA